MENNSKIDIKNCDSDKANCSNVTEQSHTEVDDNAAGNDSTPVTSGGEPAHHRPNLHNRGDYTNEESCLSRVPHYNAPYTGDEGEDDRKYLKLFVGGLPFNSTDHALHSYFSTFGCIEEAVVIRDRTNGASKGYGFVTYFHKEDAARAVQHPFPIIDGRLCNVNYAYIGARNRNEFKHKGSYRSRNYDHMVRCGAYQMDRYPQVIAYNDYYAQLAMYQNCLQTAAPFIPRTANSNEVQHRNQVAGVIRSPYAIPIDYGMINGFGQPWHYGLAYAPGPTIPPFYYANGAYFQPTEFAYAQDVSRTAYRSNDMGGLSESMSSVNISTGVEGSQPQPQPQPQSQSHSQPQSQSGQQLQQSQTSVPTSSSNNIAPGQNAEMSAK